MRIWFLCIEASIALVMGVGCFWVVFYGSEGMLVVVAAPVLVACLPLIANAVFRLCGRIRSR